MERNIPTLTEVMAPFEKAERDAKQSAVDKIKSVAERVRGNPYMDHISRVEVTLTAAEILALADSY